MHKLDYFCRYQPSKDSDLLIGPYGNLKRIICETRDKPLIPTNKRQSRLKDALLEFEVTSSTVIAYKLTIITIDCIQDILSHNIVVHVEWTTKEFGSCIVVISNGLIIHLVVDLSNSNLKDVVIDRSLEGKLPAEIVNGWY